MREFILRTSKASTNPNFNVNNLPKAGRMDIVCRCVINALFVSEAIRKDTIFHAILNGSPNSPRLISFYGNEIKQLYPYERTIAEQIKLALGRGLKLKLNEEKEVESGTFIAKKSFEQLIKENIGKQILYLHPEGIDIKEFQFKGDFVAILSDYKRLPQKVESFLERLNIEKISLGKTEYLASQVINIINYVADRRGL